MNAIKKLNLPSLTILQGGRQNQNFSFERTKRLNYRINSSSVVRILQRVWLTHS